MRGSQCGSWKRQGSPGLAVSAVWPAAAPSSRARSVAARHRPTRGLQVHFRGAFLSLRSALSSRRVRSLPEARAGAQGSPLTAAVGVDLGGREGGSRLCLLPLPPLLRFFPLLNARCHLFAASHVSIVACQELWPGFGGPGLDHVKEQEGDEHGNLGVLLLQPCAPERSPAVV